MRVSAANVTNHVHQNQFPQVLIFGDSKIRSKLPQISGFDVKIGNDLKVSLFVPWQI